MRTNTAWLDDVHIFLLGAGSFIDLCVAGLITSAIGLLGRFEKRVHGHD